MDAAMRILKWTSVNAHPREILNQVQNDNITGGWAATLPTIHFQSFVGPNMNTLPRCDLVRAHTMSTEPCTFRTEEFLSHNHLQRAELGQKIPQDAVIKLGIDKVEPVVIAARDEVNLFRGPGGGEYPLRVGA